MCNIYGANYRCTKNCKLIFINSVIINQYEYKHVCGMTCMHNYSHIFQSTQYTCRYIFFINTTQENETLSVIYLVITNLQKYTFSLNLMILNISIQNDKKAFEIQNLHKKYLLCFICYSHIIYTCIILQNLQFILHN